MGGPTRKIIRATREITVNIHGEEFDALLVPKLGIAEVDFCDYPEDDPLRKKVHAEKMTKVDLEINVDLVDPYDGKHAVYRLTEDGATKLLDSL